MLKRLLLGGLLACLVLGGIAFVGGVSSTADADPGKIIAKRLKCVATCSATAHAIFKRCMDEGGLPNACSAEARAWAKGCRNKCLGK